VNEEGGMKNEEKIGGDQGEVFEVKAGSGVSAFVCNGFVWVLVV